MLDIESISCQIIANVGMARSLYLEAVSKARNKEYDKALKMIDEGYEMFIEGQKAHMQVLEAYSNGEHIEYSPLLTHAEDQMIETETIKVLSEELINVYKDMKGD
ncbi:MAG: PTS lactose/cellobiose transporter subunit IIA [Erysipelotrichaceae bacterium]|nr:PTS lactose/cellobiose transporter subunit IIA [Erysipelotrichaceae bacterium]